MAFATRMTRRAQAGSARAAPRTSRPSRVPSVRVKAAAAENENLGFKTMRPGIKEASEDSILTPRFYTTDFDEMERMFSLEINPNLDMHELEAMLAEFKEDYNQKHFVRNETFKNAADKITGETRRIFIEFLERSCTAEFSGFLLYKELGRRMKTTNPVVAEIFTLMSRDEARHAGFLNKGECCIISVVCLHSGVVNGRRGGGKGPNSTPGGREHNVVCMTDMCSNREGSGRCLGPAYSEASSGTLFLSHT